MSEPAMARPAVVAQARPADSMSRRSSVASPSGAALVQRLRDPVRRNKARFNSQQMATIPGKTKLVSTIGDTLEQILINENLNGLWSLRELLDILASTYADGLIAIGEPGDNDAEIENHSKAWSLQNDIMDLRQAAEFGYQTLIGMDDDADTVDLTSAIVPRLTQLWTKVNSNGNLITNVVCRTTKTGARETRTWRNQGAQGEMDSTETDNSIDIRSAMIAKVVKADRFIPEVIVGLPTAGVQIAARVAGFLDAKQSSLGDLTKTIALRPKYVKPSGAAATSQDDVDKLNKTHLADNLEEQFGLGGPSLLYFSQPGMRRVVRVLVVDDFSLSGGSLAHAAELVRTTLTNLGFTPDVRTAVSRYTSAQLRNGLSAENDNPIDYIVGSQGSGSRKAVAKELLDEDGYFPKDVDQAQLMERGLTETGQDALDML
jgi:hypoxanthine phosphoribosyltransferase